MIPTVLVFARLAALLHPLASEDAAHDGLLPVHLTVSGFLAGVNCLGDPPVALATYLGVTRGTAAASLAKPWSSNKR